MFGEVIVIAASLGALEKAAVFTYGGTGGACTDTYTLAGTAGTYTLTGTVPVHCVSAAQATQARHCDSCGAPRFRTDTECSYCLTRYA